MRIGLLHPGNMGAALTACLEGEVLWASEGRSETTKARAREAGIVDLGSVESLVAAVDVVMSVCPPAAAEGVAGQVRQLGFDGLYVDLNAVSPAAARRMGRRFVRFVDGGIVGPPPTSDRSGTNDTSGTRLYASGAEAEMVETLFAGSPVDVRVIGSEPGDASALKMSYAAWTKGTTALLLSVGALAASEGVMDELYEEWEISMPDLRERLERACARIGMKAWRFAGEMEQIANSYVDAGLPDGFHLAAADLYSSLAALKDDPPGQLPDEIFGMLLDG